MRLLTGLLIVGLFVGVVILVMKVKEEAYWSDPSRWNRTIRTTSHSATQETGEQRDYTGVTSYEQTDVVGSREVKTNMTGEAQGKLLGDVQQRYDSHANFNDGREYQGSLKDDMTYNLHMKKTDGTEQDIEGTFPSRK